MTTVPMTGRALPAWRPIALPAEHGGWGFLLEPIVLAIAIAPSLPGVLIAFAFFFGFLVRQPLKLAFQDLRRGRSYPRTRYCWMFAASFATAAALALAAATVLAGPSILIPLAVAAPLAITQIAFDANNKGRSLLPELSGAAAMTSSAAAIALAGGVALVPAAALSGLMMARLLPAIVYVRTLVTRSHGKTSSPVPALALHGVAVAAVVFFASPLAVVAMVMLLLRAAWGLTHDPPPAKAIGWREIVFGAAALLFFINASV